MSDSHTVMRSVIATMALDELEFMAASAEVARLRVVLVVLMKQSESIKIQTNRPDLYSSELAMTTATIEEADALIYEVTNVTAAYTRCLNLRNELRAKIKGRW